MSVDAVLHEALFLDRLALGPAEYNFRPLDIKPLG